MIFILSTILLSVLGCDDCIHLRNNGECDKECNTEECDWDGDDCNKECYPGCKIYMISDGICQESCITSECERDGIDCFDECSEECLKSKLGNGKCDQECNREECQFDHGDCVEDVWVRNSSTTGNGSFSQPFNSLSVALKSVYSRDVVRIQLLPGVHYISGVIIPNISIKTLIIQKGSCSYCDGKVTIRPNQTATRFSFVNLLNVTIRDLTFDWKEKLIKGCEMSECIYCFTWICQGSVCTTPSGVPVTRTGTRLNYCQTRGCTDDYKFLYFNKVSKVSLSNLTFQNIALASEIISGYYTSFSMDSLLFTDIQLTGPLIYLESSARAGTPNTFLDNILYSMPYIENTNTADLSNITIKNINTYTHFNPKSFCDKANTSPGLVHAKYMYAVDIENVKISDFYVISESGVNKGMIDCDSCPYVTIKNLEAIRVYIPYGGFINMKPTLVMGEFYRENVLIEGVYVEDCYLGSSSLVVFGTNGLVGNVEMKELRAKNLTGVVSIIKVEYPNQDAGNPHFLEDINNGKQWTIPKRYLKIHDITISHTQVSSVPLFNISNLHNSEISSIHLSSISPTILSLFPKFFSAKSYSTEEFISSTLLSPSACTSFFSIKNTLNSTFTDFTFESNICYTGSLIQSSNSTSSLFNSLNFTMNESIKLIEDTVSTHSIYTLSDIYSYSNINTHSLIHLKHDVSNTITIQNSHFIHSRVHVLYLETPYVKIQGCEIVSSNLDYGAIYITGKNKEVEIEIYSSKFEGNTATEKAADVYMDVIDGEVRLSIEDSVFLKSTGKEAVSIETSQGMKITAEVKRCIFDSMDVKSCKM